MQRRGFLKLLSALPAIGASLVARKTDAVPVEATDGHFTDTFNGQATAPIEVVTATPSGPLVVPPLVTPKKDRPPDPCQDESELIEFVIRRVNGKHREFAFHPEDPCPDPCPDDFSRDALLHGAGDVLAQMEKELLACSD